MSGEVNGNLFLIYKGAAGTAVVGGQGEFALNIGGEPIPLTNKTAGAWQTYLQGSTTTKSVTFTGTMTFSDDATATAVLNDATTATADDYVIKMDTQRSWAGKFIPNVTAFSGAVDSPSEVSITFLSTGVVTES